MRGLESTALHAATWRLGFIGTSKEWSSPEGRFVVDGRLLRLLVASKKSKVVAKELPTPLDDGVEGSPRQTGCIPWLAAWCSGNEVGRINEVTVTLRRARLVLGWVTCPGSTSGGGTLFRYVTSHPGRLSGSAFHRFEVDKLSRKL